MIRRGHDDGRGAAVVARNDNEKEEKEKAGGIRYRSSGLHLLRGWFRSAMRRRISRRRRMSPLLVVVSITAAVVVASATLWAWRRTATDDATAHINRTRELPSRRREGWGEEYPPPRRNGEDASATIPVNDRAVTVSEARAGLPDACRPPVDDDVCSLSFRCYPPHRYYSGGMNRSEPEPAFLSGARYVRGARPVFLADAIATGSSTRNSISAARKICAAASLTSLSTDERRLWPRTDGHNPSVVSLSNLGTNARRVLGSLIPGPPNADPDWNSFLLASVVFGHGQCNFGMSPAQMDEYRFSEGGGSPPVEQTVLALLDSSPNSPLRAVRTTPLLFEWDGPVPPLSGAGAVDRDAKLRHRWKRRAEIPTEDKRDGHARSALKFDDARWFVHDDRLWITYRNTPLFGYEEQAFNPIHFEAVAATDNSTTADGHRGSGHGSPGWVAYVRATETSTVCCGRNIAFLSEGEEEEDRRADGDGIGSANATAAAATKKITTLRALTWIDPVTVADAPPSFLPPPDDATAAIRGTKRLPPKTTKEDARRERQKSHVHGTNGQMILLPRGGAGGGRQSAAGDEAGGGRRGNGEYLGLAHFHRPSDRNVKSKYAVLGHHYTHAFFTIQRTELGARDVGRGGRYGDYALKRMSNEFVFHSNSPHLAHAAVEDAGAIQFASGLDLVLGGGDGGGAGGRSRDDRPPSPAHTHHIRISYGINDCESATLTIPLNAAEQMLIPVVPGEEVADLMM